MWGYMQFDVQGFVDTDFFLLVLPFLFNFTPPLTYSSGIESSLCNRIYGIDVAQALPLPQSLLSIQTSSVSETLENGDKILDKGRLRQQRQITLNDGFRFFRQPHAANDTHNDVIYRTQTRA